MFLAFQNDPQFLFLNKIYVIFYFLFIHCDFHLSYLATHGQQKKGRISLKESVQPAALFIYKGQQPFSCKKAVVRCSNEVSIRESN